MLSFHSTRSCYQTFIDNEGVCTATPLFQNEPIPLIQIKQRQFLAGIFSPGFFSANETYANDLLCRYNVECPQGLLLYFKILRESLQNPVNGKCVDSIHIDRPTLNTKLETCGDQNEGFENLEMSNLRVEFRTNDEIGNCGFFIFALCFDPSLQDERGCTSSAPKTPYRYQRDTVSTCNIDLLGI